MTETLEFDDTGLDRWTDDERFDVTQDRLAEYAAATNDPIEAHRRGDVAPPVFAIVPVFEALLPPAVDVMPVEAIPRIVHGEQDFRVPYTQGLELFTALQMQKVPSKLLLFPDEGHWVLKPQNSILWYKTFIDWMDSWVTK